MRGVNEELAAASAHLETLGYAERVEYAVRTWGESLLFTSSFGADSGVLLHLWSVVARGLPVVFLDTGFHFDETIAYRDRLVEQLGLTLTIVTPSVARDDFLVEHGADIQARRPDFCCQVNKVDPLAPWVAKADAWMSGLRRDQSDTRRDVPILLENGDGPVKVHPLATMTQAEVQAYLATHGIPAHPLVARRYLSIGCWPCTRAVADGERGRDGRWAGQAKTECGLHAPALNVTRKAAS